MRLRSECYDLAPCLIFWSLRMILIDYCVFSAFDMVVSSVYVIRLIEFAVNLSKFFRST